MARPENEELYESMVKLCSKCNGTGLNDDSRCDCYFHYVHHIVCRDAGFSESIIKASIDIDFELISVPVLVERRLVYIVAGNLDQIHAYICRQIWEYLDLFSRVDSPERKFTIAYVEKGDQVPKVDIICTPFIPSGTFSTAEFHEDIQSRAKGVILMLHYDREEDDREKHDTNFKARTMRMYRKAGIQRSAKILDVSGIEGFDPWRNGE